MLINYIKIFFIAALPIIELRGAIPYSQIYNLPYIPSLLFAIIGNLMAMPLVYYFAKEILNWGKDKKFIGKFFSYVLRKGHNAGEELIKKSKNGIFIALLLFVAVPIPGTGAYTGMLAASILDIDFKKSFLAISLGVIGAAIIVSILTFAIKAI